MEKELETKQEDKNETVEQYSYKDILTMLGGNTYYSEATTMYIYYASNGKKEEAEHYLKITKEEAQAYRKPENLLKTQAEIDLINKNNNNNLI